MYKLINEVKKEMECKNTAIEKDKIRRMLLLIDSKTNDVAFIEQQINELKKELENRDYSSVNGYDWFSVFSGNYEIIE